jgi:hypothetical protein
MDRDLIEEIKAAKTILEPIRIKVVKEADGSESYALIDGKTRLTSIAEAIKEFPELATAEFAGIPFIPVKGTDEEAYVLMGRLNLQDSRKPLTDLEAARFLLTLDQRGISEDTQLSMLGKSGTSGKAWLRKAKDVAASPVLSKAVEEGVIPMATAAAIAKETQEPEKAVEHREKAKRGEAVKTETPTVDEEEERQKKLAQVEKKKSEGKTEKEVKKEVTSKPDNKTSQGYRDAWDQLVTAYPEIKKALYRLASPGFDLDNDVKWDDEDARAEFLLQYRLYIEFKLYLVFLKLPSKMYYAMEHIENQLSDEQRELLIDWMPPIPAAPKLAVEPAVDPEPVE